MANCLLLFGNTHYHGVMKQAGPFRLATELRQAGFDTQCIDIGMLTKKDFPLLEKLINKYVDRETLWVGISTTFMDDIFGIPIKRLTPEEEINLEFHPSIDRTFLEQFIVACMKRNPMIKFIIGGGIYFNLHKYDFYHFRGYADREIVEFTKWCKDPSFKPNINRVGRMIQCDQDFEHFPTSVIKWEKNDIIAPTDVLPIEIARGCIFKCKFCNFPLNGKTKGEWIKRADVLYREFMYNYETFGTTKYGFMDDTYNDSIDKITNLYEHVFSKLPFKIEFTAFLRLDLLHRFKESAEILKLSGLKAAVFGIETINRKSAKAIGKGLDIDIQLDCLRELKANHFSEILTHSNFILGLPHDTKETLLETEQFLLSDKNPLDRWKAVTLNINPVSLAWQKTYFSDIDLNYEQYGYTVTKGQHNSSSLKWALPANDLDYYYCETVADRINYESRQRKNYRIGGFDWCRAAGLCASEDVLKLSNVELEEKYNLNNQTKIWCDNYFKRLLEDNNDKPVS